MKYAYSISCKSFYKAGRKYIISRWVIPGKIRYHNEYLLCVDPIIWGKSGDSGNAKSFSLRRAWQVAREKLKLKFIYIVRNTNEARLINDRFDAFQEKHYSNRKPYANKAVQR